MTVLIPKKPVPKRTHVRYSMHNSSCPFPSSGNGPLEESEPNTEEPRFGVIDIVEAFTAMRHEWRGQTKESRQLAEQLQAAVGTLREIERQLLDRLPPSTPAEEAPTNEDSKRFAELIADLDHQFTRAVQAVEQAETNRRLREAEEAKAVHRFFSSMNPLARWLARPLLRFVTEQREEGTHPSESAAVEGLNLVLSRLRRSMRELHLERVDTQGQPFDANIMNAIGTAESTDHPSGYVVEQFSSGYRWQGHLLRCAEVRVAE